LQLLDPPSSAYLELSLRGVEGKFGFSVPEYGMKSMSKANLREFSADGKA